MFRRGRNTYKLTIAIAEKLILDDMFGGLLYPTISMHGNADNYALKPSFVSDGLELVNVKYARVRTVECRGMNIDFLDTATAGPDGILLWDGNRD